MKNKLSLLLVLFVLSDFDCLCDTRVDLTEIAIENLYERMNDFSFWNKVHSLEFLINLGLNKEVETILKDQLSKYEMEPQKRIGYWRCMIMNESDALKKNIYIKKILEVYLNPNSSDIIHAAESLAKLSFSLKEYTKTTLTDTTQNNILEAYVNWSSIYLENNEFTIDYTSLFKLLNSDNSEYRRIIAYGTKYLGRISNYQWKKLINLALREPLESPIAIYLLCGTLNSCPTQERNNHNISVIRNNVRKLAKSDNKVNKYEAFVALGNFACPNDFDFIKEELFKLCSLKAKNDLNDQTKDILSAVSFAYLKTIGLKNNS